MTQPKRRKPTAAQRKAAAAQRAARDGSAEAPPVVELAPHHAQLIAQLLAMPQVCSLLNGPDEKQAAAELQRIFGVPQPAEQQ
jgi:hypothetical protein